MSVDKYRRARKRDSWTDADGAVITIEEAGGRDAIRLIDMSMKAAKGGAANIDAGAMIPYFVEAISISVIEDDGTRPLNSDEGRSIISEWPLPMLMSLGQRCIDLQGLGADKKN